jgi:hypothetical protein
MIKIVMVTKLDIEYLLENKYVFADGVKILLR